MPKSSKLNLAWLVQVEEEFGTRNIRAHVVIVQPDGELHSPHYGWSAPASEFADFRVSCYLGNPDYDRLGGKSVGGNLWGLTHDFSPFLVRDADHAASMTKLFNRVKRGMLKLQTESGYIADGDYLTYLTRIGSVLGIRAYNMRNDRRAFDRSGERYRRGDAAMLQYWIADTVDIAENRPADFKVGA